MHLLFDHGRDTRNGVGIFVSKLGLLWHAMLPIASVRLFERVRTISAAIIRLSVLSQVSMIGARTMHLIIR